MPDDYRMERIRRLFKELEYEIARGLEQNEIPEEIGFDFAFRASRKIPDGWVGATFRMRPMPQYCFPAHFACEPGLKLVKGGS